jgi:hypothetical protein
VQILLYKARFPFRRRKRDGLHFENRATVESAQCPIAPMS